MRSSIRMMMLNAVFMAQDAVSKTMAQMRVQNAIDSGKWNSDYGHGWGGRRRKLKRRLQNHQRNVSPSRRHG